MKRFFPPLAVLAAILALSLWNARVMEGQTSHLRSQLLQVQKLAAAENWQGAEDALADSYADWTSRQTYLHIVTEHDAVDDAEAMYQRAQAFAAVRGVPGGAHGPAGPAAASFGDGGVQHPQYPMSFIFR